jgi:hypothetical protein
MIYGNTGYKVLLLLHLLAVVIAFGPWFLNGLLPGLARRKGGEVGAGIHAARFEVSRMSQYAMYGVIVFGAATVGAASKGTGLTMGKPFIWVSALLWLVIVGVMHGMVLPAQKSLAGSGTTADSALLQRESIGVAIINVLVVVVLYLMVFEPGH